MRRETGASRVSLIRKWTIALVVGSLAAAAFAISTTPASADGDMPVADPLPPIDLPPAAAASCVSSDANLAERMSSDIQDAVFRDASGISVTVYDRVTETHCQYNSEAVLYTASIIKTTLVGALLRRAQDEGRGLTDVEHANAHAAVTRSDNDAATALYNQLGVDGIQYFMDMVGMPGTTITPTWGSSRTTGNDQTAFLQAMTTPGDILTDDRRAYLLDLMRQVIPEQRWGTPAGAPDTVAAGNKNGWFPSEGWVNSTGAFAGENRDYMMVVLTGNSYDINVGIARIEKVAHAVHRALNPDVPLWPLLQEGSYGKRVAAAQLLLNAQGAGLGVDGDYGPATTEAVRAFQTNNGIGVDGMIGDETWQTLTPDAKLGDSGDAVRAAQERLIAYGHGVTADGQFNDATDAAVREFQQARGLPDTGVVDDATWQALVS
ncbi:MAG: peptidoglycan-binding protein [Stackebrandtia sp.]